MPAPQCSLLAWVAESAAPHRLIIRLIIQTIRRDRSGAVWTDEASNLSRPDPSGADQIDVEHQATDLAVWGSNPSWRYPPSSAWAKQRELSECAPRHGRCVR
jgi:hypothetical protein